MIITKSTCIIRSSFWTPGTTSPDVVLCPGNTHASKGALAVLKRFIKKLKNLSWSPDPFSGR